MGFWNTVKNFGAVKTEKAGVGIVEALASFDPEGMSEAGMRQMEEQVDELALETAKAKQEWQKEQAEYEEIQKLYEQRMAAAEALQEQIETNPNAEASLLSLLDMIEKMAPEIEREKEEAVYAKELFDELEAATREAADGVKTARAEFEQVQREMKRAEIDKKRAETQEERAKKLAGIRKNGSSLDSAMGAMRNAASKRTAEADAAKMKAELFKTSKPEEDDPLIAAALAGASGEAPKATSAADRLAALKAKKG